MVVSSWSLLGCPGSGCLKVCEGGVAPRETDGLRCVMETLALRPSAWELLHQSALPPPPPPPPPVLWGRMCQTINHVTISSLSFQFCSSFITIHSRSIASFLGQLHNLMHSAHDLVRPPLHKHYHTAYSQLCSGLNTQNGSYKKYQQRV